MNFIFFNSIVIDNKYIYFCNYKMSQSNIEYISNSSFQLETINHSFDWLNWTMVAICVLAIIASRISNYNYIPNLFKQKTNYNSNQTTLKKFSSIILTANYVVILTLFIWQYLTITGVNFFSPIVLFVIIFGGLIVGIFSKFAIIYMVDVVFNRKVHFHINLHLSYFQLSGVLLVPFYILSFFAPVEIKSNVYLVVLVLFSLTLIIRELKSLFTALNNRISLLYIILYLCTLEILPLILAIKILKG